MFDKLTKNRHIITALVGLYVFAMLFGIYENYVSIKAKKRLLNHEESNCNCSGNIGI